MTLTPSRGLVQLALVALPSLLASGPAWGQIYTAPRRPGQSVVRWDAHDWRTLDLLVDEQVGGERAGGIRLYFYEGERAAAERAAAQIEAAYATLAEQFRFTPPERFPYILYHSYSEFLRTNLFPLQEGVLGVTSTRSLEVTLPTFGDHRLFTEVSTHELAHEFTIQKVRAVAEHAGVARDPLAGMPLWFVEGLAEYHAQGGLEPRARLLVRDLVTNPDLYSAYGLLGFYDDYPWSVVWTYQVGLARVVFLEERYGEGTLQAILEASPMLATGNALAAPGSRFAHLVERITGDDADTIDDRFQAWVKELAFTEWVGRDQGPGDTDRLAEVRGYVGALDASPDGTLVAFRDIERDTGRSRLFVTHAEDPTRQRRVLADGVPGAESLHPVDPRSFDLGEREIVVVAESRGRDTLVARSVQVTSRLPRHADPERIARREAREARHEERRRERARKRGEEPTEKVAPPPWTERPPTPTADAPLAITDWAMREPPPDPEEARRYRVHLGAERRTRLGPHDLLAAYSPALSPDGSRVAFVGLHEDGQRDVFLLEGSGRRATVRRLTDDEATERHLSWGTAGLVFASDATDHGYFNLFRIDPAAGGPPARLTTEPRDHLSPVALADGRVFFGTMDDGHGDLHELTPDGPAVRTDQRTAVSEAAPGREGGLWALLQHQGRRQPVHIPADALRAEPPRPQPEGRPAAPLPTRSLAAAVPYRPLDARNWQPDGLFGFAAAGPGGIFGQLYASATDQLRDRALVLSALFLGNLELSDGYLLYVDQSRRVTWGVGPFQSLRFPFDLTADPILLHYLYERFTGGLVTGRLPVDRFLYGQLDLSLGASRRFVYPRIDTLREWARDDRCADCTDLADAGRRWERRSDFATANLQGEATLRLGYDNIRFHRATGPHAGASVLLESTAGAQPTLAAAYASARADAQAFLPLPIGSGSNLGARAAVGTSTTGELSHNFFLSSYDTLRGVVFADSRFLLGQHFWFTNAELQVPLDALIRVALASSVEAVVGVDFGGTADALDGLWDRRVLDLALGGNLVIGPLVFRVHFAHPFDVGAPLPVDDPGTWVPNVSLSYLQL